MRLRPTGRGKSQVPAWGKPIFIIIDLPQGSSKLSFSSFEIQASSSPNRSALGHARLQEWRGVNDIDSMCEAHGVRVSVA